VKPLLISRGAAMPSVLVLLGVFGGVLAFGFIGVFLGPTLLAVGYSLTRKWVGVEARATTWAGPGGGTRTRAPITGIRRNRPEQCHRRRFDEGLSASTSNDGSEQAPGYEHVVCGAPYRYGQGPMGIKPPAIIAATPGLAVIPRS
jgi:hypothetical protein